MNDYQPDLLTKEVRKELYKIMERFGRKYGIDHLPVKNITTCIK
mgnify:CR=1 FL=1